ncbi:hypothetical protein PF010_g6703 [Phytophthora fragariae]|uniref:Uncharacterized protein n=1 Tax=Phytophthora fragariae TaxID=53985 RepID=A0A6G0LK84_9STRA|nr:hypothetical protein PF010_g6703 [Phytophthora fragariae]
MSYVFVSALTSSASSILRRLTLDTILEGKEGGAISQNCSYWLDSSCTLLFVNSSWVSTYSTPWIKYKTLGLNLMFDLPRL